VLDIHANTVTLPFDPTVSEEGDGKVKLIVDQLTVNPLSVTV